MKMFFRSILLSTLLCAGHVWSMHLYNKFIVGSILAGVNIGCWKKQEQFDRNRLINNAFQGVAYHMHDEINVQISQHVNTYMRIPLPPSIIYSVLSRYNVKPQRAQHVTHDEIKRESNTRIQQLLSPYYGYIGAMTLGALCGSYYNKFRLLRGMTDCVTKNTWKYLPKIATATNVAYTGISDEQFDRGLQPIEQWCSHEVRKFIKRYGKEAVALSIQSLHDLDQRPFTWFFKQPKDTHEGLQSLKNIDQAWTLINNIVQYCNDQDDLQSASKTPTRSIKHSSLHQLKDKRD